MLYEQHRELPSLPKCSECAFSGGNARFSAFPIFTGRNVSEAKYFPQCEGLAFVRLSNGSQDRRLGRNP